jgi:hypothetical protein
MQPMQRSTPQNLHKNKVRTHTRRLSSSQCSTVQGRGQYTAACCSGTGFVCPNPPCESSRSASTSSSSDGEYGANQAGTKDKKKSKRSRSGDDSSDEDRGKKSKKKKDKHRKKDRSNDEASGRDRDDDDAVKHMPSLEPRPLNLPHFHGLMHGDNHGPRGLIHSLFGGPPHGRAFFGICFFELWLCE